MMFLFGFVMGTAAGILMTGGLGRWLEKPQPAPRRHRTRKQFKI
jgi:hypothetical protein